MALTANWTRIGAVSNRRVGLKRINNHIRLCERDRLAHLFVPPTIVKRDKKTGEILETITPSRKKKGKKK